MKKIVFLIVVGFVLASISNANELKCDSKETKIALATEHLSLNPQEIKTLRQSNEIKGNRATSEGGEEIYGASIYEDEKREQKLEIWKADEYIYMKYVYAKFTPLKTDKSHVVCKTIVMVTQEDMDPDARESTFIISKDSKNNIITKTQE